MADLPVRETMKFFDEIDVKEVVKKQMKVTYLESIVERSTESEFHNQLILFYLELINLRETEQEKEAEKQKLRAFLNKSQHYNPEKLLR